MTRHALLLGAAVALVAAGTSPAASGLGESRVLWQGPVLAGDAVVWSEVAGGSGALRLWKSGRGERTVYRNDALALTRPLAASGTLLVFERTYPSCPPRPNRVCPQMQDALAGPPAGPFRTLVQPRTCALATEGPMLAVDHGVAATLELGCESGRLRVVVRDVARGARPLVVHDGPLPTGCCPGIALAGRYVAWAGGRADIVVFDHVARRTAYRARIPGGGADEVAFDLQADGKLAVAYRRATEPPAVAWFSRSDHRPHVLPLRARSSRVRIADDVIAFERPLRRGESALVLSDLVGHARTVATFAAPIRLGRGFDFDGSRIAWADDRVTATRENCPPPGQERACFLVESGTTTIRLRTLPAGPTRVVVRLPFVDAVARR